MSDDKDDSAEKLWIAFGGSFHGPFIETANIPKSKLFKILRWFTRTGFEAGHAQGVIDANAWVSVGAGLLDVDDVNGRTVLFMMSSGEIESVNRGALESLLANDFINRHGVTHFRYVS